MPNDPKKNPDMEQPKRKGDKDILPDSGKQAGHQKDRDPMKQPNDPSRKPEMGDTTRKGEGDLE